MEIRCESCSTEYELDEDRVGPNGLAVRCTTCGSVFKAYRPAPAPVAAPMPPPPTPTGFVVRRPDQSTLPCPDLATLQRWVVERRVTRLDTVRENDGPWRRLDTLPELAPFFAVIEPPAAAPPPPVRVPEPKTELTPPLWAPPPRPAADPAAPVDETAAMDSGATLQFGFNARSLGARGSFGLAPADPPKVEAGPPPSETETIPYHHGVRLPESVRAAVEAAKAPAPPPAPPAEPAFPTAVASPVRAPAPAPQAPARTPEPAPARKPAAKPSFAEEEDELDDDPEIARFRQRSGAGRAVAFVLVLLIAGAGAGYAFYGEEIRARLFAEEASTPDVASTEDFDAGRRVYLGLEVERFAEAREAYSRALDRAEGAEAARIAAALAELETAWAEHLRVRASRLPAAASPDADAPNPKETLQAEAKDHLDRAYDYIRKAWAVSPDSPAADRALVDYYRVAGSAEQIASASAKMERAEDPETRAHLAMAAARDEAGLERAEATLQATLEAAPGFRRARLWLAQVRTRRGDAAGAQPLWAELGLAVETKKVEQGKVANAAPPPEVKPAAVELPPRKTAPPVPTKQPETGATPRFSVDRAMGQANRLMAQGKAEQALALYDQVVEARPKHVEAHYGRGLALFDLERSRDAIEAQKRALEINPGFADAMIGLAEAYKDVRQHAEAVRWYRRYLEVLPQGDQAAVAKANVDALSP